MHILMLAERLSPAIGGVERHVGRLTRVLTARGCRVTSAAPKHDPMLPDEEEMDGARVIRLPCAGHQRWDYLRAWHWWSEHRSLLDKVDVIHFHSVYSLLHRFGPTRFLCDGKPLYLTYHGCEMRYPIPRRARLYRRLGERLVRGSICIGHYLTKWFNLRPQIITYGGVTPPQELPSPSLAPRAVFVGRVAPDTGLDTYLRGLGLLKRKHNLNLPLTVCGDGPLRAKMECMAAQEKVDATFEGFKPNPTEYLAKGTVALTSGFLAILEAAALRRPIFSVYHNPVKESYLRDIPNAKEMLHIAGTPEQLAEQLADHLRSPDHAAVLVEQAAAFAAQHSWERLADGYLQLWSQERR